MLNEFIYELKAISHAMPLSEVKEQLDNCIGDLYQILIAYEEKNDELGAQKINAFLEFAKEWPEIDKNPDIAKLFKQYLPRVSTYSEWLYNDNALPAGISNEVVDYLGNFLPNQSLISLGLSCTFFKNGLDKVFSERKKILQVIAWDFNTYFIKDNGLVFGCGVNNKGELGVGHKNEQSIPIQLPNLFDIVEVAIGISHNLFLKKNGDVYGCGSNILYQLGLGDEVRKQLTPIKLTNLFGICQVAAGHHHSLFLTTEGRVFGCGINDRGQLNLEDSMMLPLIEQLPGLDNISQIAAGYDHSLFLKKDGTVWGCGSDEHGQLGFGKHSKAMRLTQLPDLNDISKIFAGSYYTYFLKKDGKVLGCGLNTTKQFGLENEIQSTPVELLGLSDISQIAAGQHHSLFLSSDGRVWGCGKNTSGELGLEVEESQHTPRELPNFFDVRQIAGGFSHIVFLKKDGTFWGSGSNGSGQLGLPESIKSSNTPIKLEVGSDTEETTNISEMEQQKESNFLFSSVGSGSSKRSFACLVAENSIVSSSKNETPAKKQKKESEEMDVVPKYKP